MLIVFQMIQMNLFFLLPILTALVCVTMNTGEFFAVFPAFASGVLLFFLAFSPNASNPFGILSNQYRNQSFLLRIYISVITALGSMYVTQKFYTYFECDQKALTVQFEQLKIPQKKKFLHLENYSVRPMQDHSLFKTGWGIYAFSVNRYQMTELLADPLKQEKTNIWLVCERCSFEEAKNRMNGKNAYIKRSDSNLTNLLPELDPDADRESAIFYILMRGSLEDERKAVLQDFFTAAGAANLGFLFLTGVFLLLRYLEEQKAAQKKKKKFEEFINASK